MEGKKCWRHGICGAVSALVVFFLICMFLFPSVGVEQIESFIVRHGSLIAGLIGFGGVIWLISNQNKATKETVEATLKAILLESSAIEKRMHKKDIVEIVACKDDMHITMVNKKGHRVYSDYQNNLHKIREVAKRLVFLIVNKNNSDRYKGLLFINSFFIFYDELFKLSGREFTSQIDLDVVNVNAMRKSALQYLKDWGEHTRDENKRRNEIILNNITCLDIEIKVVPIVDDRSGEKLETGKYALHDYFLSEMSRPFDIIDMVLQDVIKVLDDEE